VAPEVNYNISARKFVYNFSAYCVAGLDYIGIVYDLGSRSAKIKL